MMNKWIPLTLVAVLVATVLSTSTFVSANNTTSANTTTSVSTTVPSTTTATSTTTTETSTTYTTSTTEPPTTTSATPAAAPTSTTATTEDGNSTSSTTAGGGGAASPPSGPTTSFSYSTYPPNSTHFTLLATFTTVTAPVPGVRAAEDYRLVLSGTKDEWAQLVNNSAKRANLVASLRKDLATRFFTREEFISILRLIVGSLHVTFAVAPSTDGTHINEGAFLASSKGDTSWLKATSKMYSEVSSSKLEIETAGYSNTTKTQPPAHSVCADGCGGFIGGGAAVLFVVAALLIFAWRRHSKDEDDMERDKMEADEMDGVVPTGAVGMSPMPMNNSGVFSSQRGGSVVRGRDYV